MMLNLSGLLVWILMLTFLLPPKGLMKHFEVVLPSFFSVHLVLNYSPGYRQSCGNSQQVHPLRLGSSLLSLALEVRGQSRGLAGFPSAGRGSSSCLSLH